MPISRLRCDAKENEITPAPPIVTTNLQFHRNNKVGSTPLIQAKIDIYQAQCVVDKALNIKQKYERIKAENNTLLSFFCCIPRSKREVELDYISCIANDMQIKLSLAGMELDSNPSNYKNVRAAAKNAELIIWGSYIYVLRKIKSSYLFYDNLLRRKSDPAESVLYRIVSEYLRERDSYDNDIDYLINLSDYLARSIQTGDTDYLLKEEWLRKIQSQITELSELNKDTRSDEEIAYSDDEPLILLQK